MHRVAALATILAVAGCNALHDPVEGAVKAELRDPASARFRNVRTMASGITCGEVNAKNAVGGYSGFQKFIVDRRGQAIVGQGMLEDGASLEPAGQGFPEGGMLRFMAFDYVWEQHCITRR